MAEEGDFLLLLTKLFGVLRETLPNAVRSPLVTFTLTSPSLFYPPRDSHPQMKGTRTDTLTKSDPEWKGDGREKQKGS